MTTKYYLDTCVWRDFFEDRKGFGEEDLGKEATELIKYIIKRKNLIICSEVVVRELKKYNQQYEEYFNFLHMIKILTFVTITQNQFNEANILSKNDHIPFGDTAHAIIARDAQSILVTQDKHLLKLKKFSVNKPSEVYNSQPLS